MHKPGHSVAVASWILGRAVEVFRTHDAGVVDHDVKRGKIARHLRRNCADAFRVLDIQDDCLQSRIRGGRFFKRFAPAAGNDNLIACLDKRFRQSASDTRRAARHKDSVASDVHLFCVS